MMQPIYTFVILAEVLVLAHFQAVAQAPVVDSRGVLNSATLAPAGPMGAPCAAQGSLATIFGQNLAPVTAAATQTPLPTSLGGVSIRWSGGALPLFYVSPGQINFQVPNNFAGLTPITIQTPTGTSAPMTFFTLDALGIFTQDGSGCGPAWIFNVGPDGSWSLNSPNNSIEPGGVVTILGTGSGQVNNALVLDGEPTPSTPLPYTTDCRQAPDIPTNGMPAGGSLLYVGRAPGLIGVDQFNFKLPDNTIEGCGVPLKIPCTYVNSWDSQPVPINVHRGGGKCGSLPAAQSYADLTLQKTTTISGGSSSTNEELNATVSAAVGKNVPVRAIGAAVGQCYCATAPPPGWVSGPSCPFPAFVDKPVGIGSLTISGPNVNVQYTPQPTDTSFQVALPSGSLVPGSFAISAQTGSGAGPFAVAVPVMADIQFNDPAPGGIVDGSRPVVLTWTGGQADEVVRVRLRDTRTWRFCECAQQASTGGPTGFDPMLVTPAEHPGELTVSLESSPASVSFTAPGLTLGGQARWSRIWYYPNVTIKVPGVSGSAQSKSFTASGLSH